LQTSSDFRSSPLRTPGGAIVFEGARVSRSAFNAKHRTVSVRGSRIDSVCMPQVGGARTASKNEVAIDLSGFMVFPGLVNAHDHLDFSLFPRLGEGPYPSWREWAADIYHPGESPVEEHLRVPRETRFWWGGIRNLLSGVTTVSQHDRYLDGVFQAGFPVHVPYKYGWAHSLSDIPQLIERFHQTPAAWPFILHLAEGTDEASERELDILEQFIRLEERIVLVHGVGLTPAQWQRVIQAGIGAVWCPSSNLHTLGQTIGAERILTLPNVALGTDSPISSTRDLLDELGFIHRELRISASFAYDLVTTKAARLLHLRDGQGALQNGSRADLVVARDREATPAEALVQMSWRDIELVMEGGRIVLLSAELSERVPEALKEGMEWIFIDGVKRLLRAPVRELMLQAELSLGRTPSLTGRHLALEETSHPPIQQIARIRLLSSDRAPVSMLESS
jgi:cytosine/adenosine deaminase-related metal-dependent hydrolase